MCESEEDTYEIVAELPADCKIAVTFVYEGAIESNK